MTCHKDTFLQSFNVLDDKEIEFMVEIHEGEEGVLRVIKTREIAIVEAAMMFRVDSVIVCDETYIFPDQLLIRGRRSHFMQLKAIFRQQSRSEVLSLDFAPELLSFTG